MKTMATSKSVVDKTISVNKIPKIFLGNRKITVLTGSDSNLLQSLKAQQLFKEDLIYESKPGDFLNSEEKICIVNSENVTSNIRRTLVRTAGRPPFEVLKTSDDIVNLIGQANYDLVFSALCSVLSLELKVRGILALLTARKFYDNSVQTDSCGTRFVDTKSQTEESCMDELLFKRIRPKRVKRQQLTPYVVKDDQPAPKPLKRVIIQLNNIKESQNQNAVTTNNEGGITLNNEGGITLPLLNLQDENSNGSAGNVSSISFNTLPQLLDNPLALLDDIQDCTEPTIEPDQTVYCQTTLTMLDGDRVTIPVKPEDDLHIATLDILNSVTPENRTKLKLLQAYYDWKYCLERDEDGNLPIHNAVNTGDVELLKRQCQVLKLRNESVDILAGNMTAFQMSLYQNKVQASAVLLKSGADPLKTDIENRTCFHLAAEEATDHLNTIINHCRKDPLTILSDNEEFWKAGMESMSKEKQAEYLLDRISQLTDNQGYTPLMVACKLGIYDNVVSLIDMAPNSVNLQMPSTGNTALYLAVSAACIDASNRGNLKNVRENFLKIVGKLIESGADPVLDNHMGHNVNILLSEFNIGDLSQVISSKMATMNCGNIISRKGYENVMLVKDEQGKINFEHIKTEPDETKPVILENIRVDTKIDDKKLIVSRVDKEISQDPNKCFVGTFKNFIKTEKHNRSLLKTHIDLTNQSMIVIKEKRVKKRKSESNEVPVKVMKVKSTFDDSSTSDASKKD